MCPPHKRKAKKEADRRNGRVRGSRWSAIRRTVLREEPFCQVCHKETSVEVDHILPLSEGGHPTARFNLQGICRACHDEKTRGEQQARAQMERADRE